MKKFILIFLVLIYAMLGALSLSKIDVEECINSKQQFAKITTNNCPLFKTPTKNNHNSNIYFLLEESYYVEIINQQDEFYYVNYIDIQGYVLQNSVALIENIPTNPYLTNITLNASEDCYLYSYANDLEEYKIQKINKNTTLTYFGKIYANEISNFGGNLWYYVQFENENLTIKGYIYSVYTTNLTTINKNSEQIIELTSPENSNLLYLNNSTQNIIILLVSIPTSIIIFLFAKAFKKV